MNIFVISLNTALLIPLKIEMCGMLVLYGTDFQNKASLLFKV